VKCFRVALRDAGSFAVGLQESPVELVQIDGGELLKRDDADPREHM
jgi:hypothetical protein